MIRLRAHHLLCIRNFRGYGYNQEFIENFYNVIGALDKEPIEIIASADLICKKCPHLKGGVCRHKKDSENKTQELDMKVINEAGIKMRNFYAYKELKQMISNLHTRTICNDCKWKVYCR